MHLTDFDFGSCPHVGQEEKREEALAFKKKTWKPHCRCIWIMSMTHPLVNRLLKMYRGATDERPKEMKERRQNLLVVYLTEPNQPRLNSRKMNQVNIITLKTSGTYGTSTW